MILQSRAWLRRLAAGLLVAGTAGCTEPDTITIGTALQLTGTLAGTGRYYRDGYQFAVDRMNEQGGITIGDFRYKLALKIRDSQSDSARLARLQEELITRDRVHFLLGPY